MIVQNRKKRNIKMTFVHMLFVLISLICLTPFIAVITISITSEQHLREFGYSVLPSMIDLTAYKYILSNPMQIVNAYKISIIVTVFGTFFGVLFMSMTAYCLSRNNFIFRKQFMFYIFFTMLFSGGMVPKYILITQYLKLADTIAVLILPTFIVVFNIILLRTFMQKLPPSLFESAKLDGASEFLIYVKIALPLSKPSIATVSLLCALDRWNDWYTPLLYIRNDALNPLQYLLYLMMADLQFITENMQNVPDSMLQTHLMPSESARMAMCVLAMGPMMFVFPFFQKYFVKGLTVGSVKG